MTAVDRLVSRAGDGTPALSSSGAIPPARTGEAGVPALAAMAPGRGRDHRRIDGEVVVLASAAVLLAAITLIVLI